MLLNFQPNIFMNGQLQTFKPNSGESKQMIEVVLLFQPPRHPLPTQQPHNSLCMQSKGGSQLDNRNILSNILGVRGVRQLCTNHVLYRKYGCDPALDSLVFSSLLSCAGSTLRSQEKKSEERMQRITHHVQASSHTTNLYLSLAARASSKYFGIQ